MELIKPGWYKDMSDEEYHASSGTSSSNLKTLIERAPNEYLYNKAHPKDPSEAMQLGTLVHSMVLEPEKAAKKYVAMPDFGDQRRTANKEAKQHWCRQNEDKEPVKEEKYKVAESMATAVKEHPQASALLDDFIPESSVYGWYRAIGANDDRDYKEMLKVRPDAIPRAYPMLIDLKTTTDASYSGFARSIIKYYYHLSAAMYLDVVNGCKPLLEEMGNMAYTYFIFIAVENNPPYNVAVYECSRETLEIGRHLYKTAMARLHDAREENFPGYDPSIRQMEIPEWGNRVHIV